MGACRIFAYRFPSEKVYPILCFFPYSQWNFSIMIAYYQKSSGNFFVHELSKYNKTHLTNNQKKAVQQIKPMFLSRPGQGPVNAGPC